MIDIQRVGSDAELLAHQMAQVLDKVSEVERSGQQTVAALATLDAIKTRMEVKAGKKEGGRERSVWENGRGVRGRNCGGGG
eukprot:763458-Hanusia_phi.AAC.2